MSKKRRKERERRLRFRFELTPEIKKEILVIFCFALAALSILSLFDLAGKTGNFISQNLKAIFGWGNWLFPLILILLGWFLFKPEKYILRGAKILGLFLFTLSSTALLQWVIFFKTKIYEITPNQGGGYFGFFLSYPLVKIMGSWAALVILIALFLVSLLLAFETSLAKLSQKEKLKIIFDKLCKTPFLYILRSISSYRKTPKSEEEIFARKESTSALEDFPEQDSLSGSDADSNADKHGSERSEKINKQKNKEQLEIFPETKISKKIDLPLDLLNNQTSQPTSGDIKARSLAIQKTLENFGVPVEMGEIQVGPTVTQYTLKPSEGIKLSRITSLHNDLALALASHPIRIEAPIPGKSLVGIEVPNQAVATVRLRELLASEEFKKRKSNLMVALGKDVAGNVWLADLEKMPHLLIAGATGSGKTTALNSVILSLLYQNSPLDLKFILIDPKRVEFPIYNDLPHLLTPVVTDVKKTINALRWAIEEMDKRFNLFSEVSARDIKSYNASTQEKMPYIVIIIDELADLMASAPREMEACIIKLSQMARATGIHLIVATQRPSVDIITGLIKANITSRVAFSVASLMDSRTILDFSGAEKLLGRGDMLFISPWLSRPKRLQGAYLGDKEIKTVVDFLKEKAEPEYQEEILEKSVEPQKTGSFGPTSTSDLRMTEEDELLSEAKETILKYKRASASLLQRRLSIGYARAARLLDILEEQGIIGPVDGAKPREILIDTEKSDIIEEELDEIKGE